jgi:ferredoxin
LDKSIKRIDEISNGIKNYEDKKPKKSIFYNLARGISEKWVNNWHLEAKKYEINRDCIKCMKCIKVCPVENIKMVDDRIVFDNYCECCLACIHLCPKEAINYGKKTIKKKRYINPNINIEEMKK